MLFEFIPCCESFPVAGDIQKMVLMMFFVSLVIACAGHGVEHALSGVEVGAAHVEFGGVEELYCLRGGCVENSEEEQNHENGSAHDEHFASDLGTCMGDVAVKERHVEECNGNFIGVHEHALLPSEPCAVDECSVDAVEVADPGFAVFRNADFRMESGDNIVFQNNVVVGIGADADEIFFEPDEFAFAGTVAEFEAVDVARARFALFRRFDEELAVADGDAVVLFELSIGDRFPAGMKVCFAASLKTDVSGIEMKFRLIIPGDAVFGGDDPVVVRCASDFYNGTEGVGFCGDDQPSAAAEFEKIDIRPFLLLFRRRDRTAFFEFTEQFHHSSIVQMFFMIFTCRWSSGEGKRRRQSLTMRVISSRFCEACAV